MTTSQDVRKTKGNKRPRVTLPMYVMCFLTSRLEDKVLVLESQQRSELEGMREEKERLQDLVKRQTAAITALERQLRAASTNNSALQRQHQQLMKSVHTLIGLVSVGPGKNPNQFSLIEYTAQHQRKKKRQNTVQPITVWFWGHAENPKIWWQILPWPQMSA